MFAVTAVAAEKNEASGSEETAASVVQKQKYIELEESKPILFVSVSPSGKRVVYQVKNELREWPQGRTIDFSEQSPRPYMKSDYYAKPSVIPSSYKIKWSPDERELAIVHLARWGWLIDVDNFKVKRTIHDTSLVWWSNGSLCNTPLIEEDYMFTPTTQQLWYYGKEERKWPKGHFVTDISDDGEAMLALVTEKKIRSFDFNYAVVLKMDTNKDNVVWKNILPNDFDGLSADVSSSYTSSVSWNRDKNAAAVIHDGIRNGRRLFVVTKDKITALEPIYGKKYYVIPHSQPCWVGDKVLCQVSLLDDEEDTATKTRKVELQDQFILFDPWNKTVQLLLEGAKETIIRDISNPRGEEKVISDTWSKKEKLLTVSASRNGNVLAYLLTPTDDKVWKWKLIITDINAKLKIE